MQHSYSRVEIDLRKYRANLDILRHELGSTKLLLVLKANGYGLGAVGLLPAISDLPDPALACLAAWPWLMGRAPRPAR